MFIAPAEEGSWSVGIVVHSDLARCIVSFKYKRRVCWITLAFRMSEGTRKMLMGSAHLPHMGRSEKEFEENISVLDDAMGSAGKRVAQLWGIDANAEWHSRVEALPSVGNRIPPPTSTAAWEREVHLAEMLQSRGMVALNTLKKWDKLAGDLEDRFWDLPAQGSVRACVHACNLRSIHGATCRHSMER